jgi:thymidine kinase
VKIDLYLKIVITYKNTQYTMITLIIGPMFSGKTTMLLSYERRFTIAKKNICMVKWSQDTRYHAEKIVTHDGYTSTMRSTKKCMKLSELNVNEIEQADVILIDEGQFFPDLEEWCRSVEQQHPQKQIIISGLSGDYKQQPFQSISNVLGLADTIIQLKSICTVCANDAPFTIRTTQQQEQTIVGADEMYQPRCKMCLKL